MAVADNGIGALLSAAETIDTTPASGAGDDAVAVAVDTPVEGTETTGGEQDSETLVDESEELNTDGTAKSPEEREAFKAKQAELKDPLNSTTGKASAALRNQLKAWKSAADPNTPEGKAAIAAIKELHQSYERWRSVTQDLGIKGGFGEIKQMRDMVVAHGGSVQAMQDTLNSVDDIDQKLLDSAENPASASSIAEYILGDLKAELGAGKEYAAAANLANAFVDALRKSGDESSYARVTAPILSAIFNDSKVNDAVNAAYNCAKNGDTKGAMAALAGLGKWMNNVHDLAKGQREEPLSAEAKKLQEERTAFNKEKFSHYSGEIGTSARKEAYSVLAKAIAPIIRTPFWKGLSKVAQQDAVGKLVGAYQKAMGADSELQRQFKVQWAKAGSSKQADRDAAKTKLLELSKTFVSDWANKGNARKVLTDIYPQILKNGSAAQGRIASATAKREADAKATASGQPVYVASKPKDLVRNQTVSVGGKEYSAGDLVTMEIMGRGLIKTSNGGFKLVTWRKAA